MPDKFVPASRLLNKFLKAIGRRYLNLLFDLKYDVHGISGLTPPYVVIANHVNFWDPFIISLCFPEPIYFVTSDAYFRNPVLRRLLRLVGAIPKTKFVADPQTIRGVFEVSRHNGIIGIFPEGRRNWDGTTLPLRFATAKLIKSLDLPVVAILMEGACLAMPRWASGPRRGEILIHGKVLLNSQEIQELPIEAVYEKISAALKTDEYAYQQTQMKSYKGRQLAEKLELFLFTCPECKSVGTLHSCDDQLSCSACNYTVTYDNYGFFKANSSLPLHFNNPRDWNFWQLEELDRMLLRHMNEHHGNNMKSPISQSSAFPLFEDRELHGFTGGRLKPFTRIANGTLSMYPDHITYTGWSGDPLVFNVSRINGENIQANNQLEFYYNKVLYRFVHHNKCLSAYKWVKAIEIAKKIQHTEGRKSNEL